MAIPACLPPVLDRLRERLSGGLAPGFAIVRPEYVPDVDALQPALNQIFPPDQVDSLHRKTPKDVREIIDGLADRLRNDRRLLLDSILDTNLLPAALDQGAASMAAVRTWIRCCWLMEAAWTVVSAATPRGDGFVEGDLDLLRPAAARQRFVLLSEPFRYPAGWPVDKAVGPHGLTELMFGGNADHELLARVRQARRVWQGYLDEYQDHLLLAGASGDRFEAELDLVLLRDGPGSGQLVLTWAAVNASSNGPPGHTRTVPIPNLDDQAVVEAVAGRHLLPRFRLWRVLQLAGGIRGAEWAIPGLAGLAVGAAVAGMVCRDRAPCWFRAAAGLAAVTYLFLGCMAVRRGPVWTSVWSLRLPAASTVGLAVLTTMNPDWWRHSTHWYWAGLTLAGASYGYLAVEARNHGVDPRYSFSRAAGVTALGLGHAFLVSLIGLIVVVPAYAEDGSDLAGVWGVWQAGGPHAWTVLLSGTAWSLAVGVFSQILWDDRPITAPLAHLRWQKKG